jgi:hypothetical protein
MGGRQSPPQKYLTKGKKMNIDQQQALEMALENINSNAENFFGAKFEEYSEDYVDGTDYINGVIVIPENGERWGFEFKGYEVGYWVEDDLATEYEIEILKVVEIK